MNAVVKTEAPRPPIVAGAEVAALVPRSLEEAFRVSQAIAASGLAPKGIEKPEQVLVAIMAGAELGFAPFQALQSFAVVNGKPTLWGDGLLALVLREGFSVKEWFEEESDAYPDTMTAHCEVTRPDNGDVKHAKFSVADAKKAQLWSKQGPWQTNPKRMLKMRARAFACRDGAADALKGFQMREEVDDYQAAPVRDVTPQGTGMRARLEARTPVGGFSAEHVSAELDSVLDGDRLPAHDADTGEVIEAEVSEPAAEDTNDFPGDKPSTARAAPGEAAEPQPGADGSLFDGPGQDPVDWAVEQTQLLEDAQTVAAVDALTGAPGAKEMFAALQAKAPGMAKTLGAASAGKRKALADRERQG